jgi:hypothetical protein
MWKETHDILRGGPQAPASVLLLVRHKSDILFGKMVCVCDSGHVMV